MHILQMQSVKGQYTVSYLSSQPEITHNNQQVFQWKLVIFQITDTGEVSTQQVDKMSQFHEGGSRIGI